MVGKVVPAWVVVAAEFDSTCLSIPAVTQTVGDDPRILRFFVGQLGEEEKAAFLAEEGVDEKLKTILIVSQLSSGTFCMCLDKS